MVKIADGKDAKIADSEETYIIIKNCAGGVHDS